MNQRVLRLTSQFGILVAGLLVISLPAAGAPGSPPPVEAFAQLPAVSEADINPSGTQLAWIDNSGALARIVIFDLAAHREVRSLESPPETLLRNVYWADDETLLARVSVTHSRSGIRREQREWQRWIIIPVNGGTPHEPLLEFDEYHRRSTGPALVRRRTARPGKVFMSTWHAVMDHPGYSLYEVDLGSGQSKVLADGTNFTDSWVANATGDHLVRVDSSSRLARYSLTVKDGHGWRPIYKTGRCGHLNPISISADNTALLALGALCGQERVKLWSLPLDGTPMKALVEDAELDVEDVIQDPLDDSVLGVIFAGTGNKTRWLDERAESRQNGLRRSFGFDAVTILGRSADNQRAVVRVESASLPPVFHFVDFAAKRADIIQETYPRLTGVKLGSVRQFYYGGRDRYPLVAYLTVPAGTPEKNLPLVVLPHDGPEQHDSGNFDWLAQFLASRGYAVLQPQFRGSSGFGAAHADAGRRQWGLRMQDDITDAVRTATLLGIVDPKRVCIAGSGYGGYAALAGTAFTPELYACAVSVSGISSLGKMLTYVDSMYWHDRYDSWHQSIGAKSDPQVIAKSPVKSAASVGAPILLMYGTEDTVVPSEQSLVMAAALKRAGKPYELIELPGEDHGLSQSATRIRAATELERFLAKYLAPDQR